MKRNNKIYYLLGMAPYSVVKFTKVLEHTVAPSSEEIGNSTL
jgi:hypothetical protein